MLLSKHHLDPKVLTVTHMPKFMHTGGLKGIGLMYVKSNVSSVCGVGDPE